MQRLPWTSLDMASGGLPNCFILIPDTNAERAELRRSFEDAGVLDSMAFHKASISGRLNVPANLNWEPDGAVRVTVTVEGGTSPIDAWFWLVECDDGTGRRFAWWSTRHDRGQSHTWS